MTDPQRVIKVLGLISGQRTAFDGQYVVEYDPGRDGTEPSTGAPMMCHLVTTPDITRATQYDAAEAILTWQSIDPRRPTRPDGKPNRPLTAFTVEIFDPTAVAKRNTPEFRFADIEQMQTHIQQHGPLPDGIRVVAGDIVIREGGNQ